MLILFYLIFLPGWIWCVKADPYCKDLCVPNNGGTDRTELDCRRTVAEAFVRPVDVLVAGRLSLLWLQASFAAAGIDKVLFLGCGIRSRRFMGSMTSV